MINNSLVTLSYCQNYSGFKYTTPSDIEDDTAIVSQLIKSVSQYFNKYTNRKLKARNYSGNANVAQVTSITCISDVSGSLSGKDFLINTPTQDFYVWFNVSGLLVSSVDPAPVGLIGIQVNIAENDNPTAAILNALNINGAWIATAVGQVITATNVNTGICDNASADTSGFIVSTTTEGDEVDPDCIFDPFNRKVLYLPNYPINSISGLYIDVLRQFGDTTLVDPSQYAFDREIGEIYLYESYRFPFQKNVIKCEYNGGYTIIPDELQEAAAIAVEFQYKLFKEHRFGQQMSSMQHMNIRFDEKSALPEACTDILDKYVRPIL